MEMSMNGQANAAFRISCLLLVGLVLFLAARSASRAPSGEFSVLAASAPVVNTFSVGAPVAGPSALSAGTSTTVRISSFITSGSGPAVLPNGVNLLQVDAKGNVLAILGVLNDNGVNGDLQAGDQIFSGQFTFNQTAPGTIFLQASVAFRGTLKRVLSESTPLEVLPSGTPTQPRFFPDSPVIADVNGLRMPCDQVLAYFKPGTSAASISSLVSQIGGTIVGFLPGSQLHMWQIRVECGSTQDIADAVKTLLQSPIVVEAEPNYIMSKTGVIPNDPRFIPCKPGTDIEFGGLNLCDSASAAPELMQIRADQAWAITQGLSTTSDPNAPFPGPVIAIVDSGVDSTHEDLSAPGKVIKGMNFLVSPPNNNPMDDDGHGTGVAGIAAAEGNNGVGIPGVSWASPIIAEKVMDAYGMGVSSNIAAGISDAVSRGAKIINLSLGISGPGLAPPGDIAMAIDQANKAGVLVVAAAGNDFCSNPIYPAGFSSQTNVQGTLLDTTVLSVGGLDFQSNVDVEPDANPNRMQCLKESGSNFGPWVKIYAPYNAVTAQSHQCTNCSLNETYVSGKGTSFAAPFVSGTAALVWAANPQASARQVMNTLLATAAPSGTDPLGGNIVRLDAFTAVFQAAATHCITCPDVPEVTVGRSNLYLGPMVTVGVAGRGQTDSQNMSVHGVSVPLTPIIGTTSTGQPTRVLPAGYRFGLMLFPEDFPGGIGYSLNTWDSYQTGGLFDSFSVSTSIAPYWQLGIHGPIQPYSLPAQDPLAALLAPFPGSDHTCEATAFPATPPVACTFNALFVLGGQSRGTALQNFESSLGGLTLPGGRAPILPGAFFFGGQSGQTTTWLNFVLDTASPPNADRLYPSYGVFHIFDITPLCLSYQDPIVLQPATGPNCAAP
jgi:hypothetical protein